MRKIICFIFGHRYRWVKKLSSNSDLIKCSRCQCLFGMNHSVKVVLPWEDVKEFYDQFGIDEN